MNARLGLALALVAALGAGLLFWLSRDDDVEKASAALVPSNSLSSQPVTTPRLPASAAGGGAREPVGHHGRDGHHEPDDEEAIAAEGDGEPDDEERADEAPADEGDDDEAARPPASAGKADDAEPVGTLTKEAIQAAIKAVVPRVKACFEKGLEKEPDLAGRVIVQFDIEAEDGEGVVTRGEVPESETFSPFFDACVLEKVAGAQFPAPEGGGKVTVRYPFQFDPGGGYGGAPPEGP